jgi:hypothetical protein
MYTQREAIHSSPAFELVTSDCWCKPSIIDVNWWMDSRLGKMLVSCSSEKEAQCTLRPIDGPVSNSRRNTDGNTWQTFLQLEPTKKIWLVKTLLTHNITILEPNTLWYNWCTLGYHSHYFYSLLQGHVILACYRLPFILHTEHITYIIVKYQCKNDWSEYSLNPRNDDDEWWSCRCPDNEAAFVSTEEWRIAVDPGRL